MTAVADALRTAESQRIPSMQELEAGLQMTASEIKKQIIAELDAAGAEWYPEVDPISWTVNRVV